MAPSLVQRLSVLYMSPSVCNFRFQRSSCSCPQTPHNLARTLWPESQHATDRLATFCCTDKDWMSSLQGAPERVRQCASGLWRLQKAKPQMHVQRASQMGSDQKAIRRPGQPSLLAAAAECIQFCLSFIESFHPRAVAPGAAKHRRFPGPAAHCFLDTLRRGSGDIAELQVSRFSKRAVPLTFA
jgi:hypothetical protein